MRSRCRLIRNSRIPPVVKMDHIICCHELVESKPCGSGVAKEDASIRIMLERAQHLLTFTGCVCFAVVERAMSREFLGQPIRPAELRLSVLGKDQDLVPRLANVRDVILQPVDFCARPGDRVTVADFLQFTDKRDDVMRRDLEGLLVKCDNPLAFHSVVCALLLIAQPQPYGELFFGGEFFQNFFFASAQEVWSYELTSIVR